MTSKLEINSFADIKPEEFGKGLVIPEDYHQIEKVNPRLLDIMDKNLSLTFDWRDTDKDGPVHDQGVCQSCWAFTTSSTLGSALAIQQNRSADDF